MMALAKQTTLERLKGVVRHRWTALNCYFNAYAASVRHMNWLRGGAGPGQLSAQLLWWYHKLERGMCTTSGATRFFGAEAAPATCRLMREWQARGMPIGDPIYAGAVETLRTYRQRLEKTPPPPAIAEAFLADIDERITGLGENARLSTPLAYRPTDPLTYDTLAALSFDRRSVRHYNGRPVDLGAVQRAVSVAQLAPSACNRQPWRLHLYKDRDAIAAMLALQNGNDGFGHTIPLLAVVTVDRDYFHSAVEIKAPMIDAGLFLMGLLLALQAQGLASCCLNWNVMPERDREGHRRGSIPVNEHIVTFLAIGHAAPEAMVPRSPRRSIDEVIVLH